MKIEKLTKILKNVIPNYIQLTFKSPCENISEVRRKQVGNQKSSRVYRLQDDYKKFSVTKTIINQTRNTSPRNSDFKTSESNRNKFLRSLNSFE